MFRSEADWPFIEIRLQSDASSQPTHDALSNKARFDSMALVSLWGASAMPPSPWGSLGKGWVVGRLNAPSVMSWSGRGLVFGGTAEGRLTFADTNPTRVAEARAWVDAL